MECCTVTGSYFKCLKIEILIFWSTRFIYYHVENCEYDLLLNFYLPVWETDQRCESWTLLGLWEVIEIYRADTFKGNK